MNFKIYCALVGITSAWTGEAGIKCNPDLNADFLDQGSVEVSTAEGCFNSWNDGDIQTYFDDGDYRDFCVQFMENTSDGSTGC